MNMIRDRNRLQSCLVFLNVEKLEKYFVVIFKINEWHNNSKRIGKRKVRLIVLSHKIPKGTVLSIHYHASSLRWLSILAATVLQVLWMQVESNKNNNKKHINGLTEIAQSL